MPLGVGIPAMVFIYTTPMINNISVVSINIRGLNAPSPILGGVSKRFSSFRGFRKEKFGIVLIQETHCPDSETGAYWEKCWQGPALIPRGKPGYASGGVAILIGSHLEVHSFTPKAVATDSSWAWAELVVGDLTLNLISAHAPNDPNDRLLWISGLSEIVNQFQPHQSVIIGGDWNCVPSPTLDSIRPYQSLSTGGRELESCLESIGWKDVYRIYHPTSRSYTRWTRTGANRLDRIYASQDLLADLMPVEPQSWDGTDHHLVKLLYKASTKRAKRPFPITAKS